MKRRSKKQIKRNSKKIYKKSPSKNIKLGAGNDNIEIGAEGVRKGPLFEYEQKFIKIFLMTRNDAYDIFRQNPNKKIYIIRNKKIDDNVFNNRNMFLNTEAVLSYPTFNMDGSVRYNDELVSNESLRVSLKNLIDNGYTNFM